MPITLFQTNSFHFHPLVDKSIKSKFNTSKMKGIDIIVEIIKTKLKCLNIYSNHFYFLLGRTGSGKSTALPVYLYNDINSNVMITEPKINLTVGNVNSILSIPEFNKMLSLGKNIGYKNGLNTVNVSDSHNITFITKIL